MIRVRFAHMYGVPQDASLGSHTITQVEYHTNDLWFEEGRNHRSYTVSGYGGFQYTQYTRTIDIPAYFMEFKSAEDVLDFIQSNDFTLSYSVGEYIFTLEE